MARKTPRITSALFTDEDYRQLREHRHALNKLVLECDKARACGIDVTELARVRDDVDRQLAAIEQHYMSPSAQG